MMSDITDKDTMQKRTDASTFNDKDKLLDDSAMIELHLDLKFRMKPWKKALVFSFMFYLIVLFIFIVIITFMKKDFDTGLVGKISAVYLTALILSFRYMYGSFKKKFALLT